MTQTMFNNILATIGAITGIAGLCISIFVLHKERIKLEVYHPTDTIESSYIGFNKIYIDINDYGEYNYEHTPYTLMLWLRITNKSKSPTTILEISLKVPQSEDSILYSQTPDDYIIPAVYSKDEQGKIIIKSSYHFPNPTKPPLSLSPYATIEGKFCFLNIKHIDSKKFKAVLRIKTPQKTSKHRIFVNPIFPKYE